MMMENISFTLLELLIIIIIIFILAGIIAPRLDTSLKNQKLDVDSKKLASNITLAQQYSIRQKDGHRYYRVVFYNGGYKVVPYSDPMTPLTPMVVLSSINVNGDIPFQEGIGRISGSVSVIFRFDGSLNANYSPIVLTNRYSNKTITLQG